MAGESRLQKKIKNSLQRKGYLVNKIMLCSRPGWPDLCAIRKGRVVWIEVKDAGEKPEPLQEVVHEQIRAFGGIVYWVDTWEKFLELGL